MLIRMWSDIFNVCTKLSGYHGLKENGNQLEDLLFNEIIIFIDKMDLLIESRPG